MVNESTFLSFLEFKDRYRFKPSFLSFLGVISAIKQLWETTNGKNLSEVSDYKINTFSEKVLMANKPNRIVYQKLVEKKRKQPLNSQMKWLADCLIEPNETVDWVAVYRKPFEFTKISKLLVFQFKDVRANCFCASLLRTQMHTPRHTRARALSNKMRNDRAKGHCYSFAWI